MRGIAISDSPQRVDDAHAHRDKSGQQTAGRADRKRKTQPQSEGGVRKKKRGKQAIQRHAETRDGQRSKDKAEQASDKRDDQGLREHEEKYGAIRKADGFQDGELSGALAHGDGHGVAGNEQQREEHHAADRKNQKLDVAELLGETGLESRLRFGLGLKGGVGKIFINRLSHTNAIIRAVQLKDIPSRRALEALRDVFVKILPLEPALTFGAARAIAVLDAIQLELPSIGGAAKSILERNAVADLPSKAIGIPHAHAGPLAILDVVIPLIIGHHEFRIHLALIFDVDGELRKEVLLVLIDAAKPVVMGDGLDAGNGKDFVSV